MNIRDLVTSCDNALYKLPLAHHTVMKIWRLSDRALSLTCYSITAPCGHDAHNEPRSVAFVTKSGLFFGTVLQFAG